jgi:hypothetical protein
VASGEIDEVHWVDLPHLLAPENRSAVEISLPGGARSFPSFHVAGEHVWGITYRILERFLEVHGSGD